MLIDRRTLIASMAAFPLVGWAVQTYSWRSTWMGVGVVIGFGLAPIAAVIVRRTPESIGLRPDGEPPSLAAGGGSPSPASRDASGPTDLPNSRTTESPNHRTTELAGYTWTAALTMPSFWVFAVGTALYGLVASGIGLFNESILAERGFGPDVYYQTLAVTALTALIGNFLGGWLSSRVPLGRLMAISLAILAGGVFVLPFVSRFAHVMTWAVAMGLGGGLVMVLFFSVWGRVFGRRHLGRIQGAAQALTVVASAIGPLLLAWCLERTGSYTAMFEILSASIAVVAIAALVISLPDAPPVLDTAHMQDDPAS